MNQEVSQGVSVLSRINVLDIEFPQIEGVPRMFIIKRYSQKGDGETSYRYLFYPARITDDVAESLREILSSYVASLLDVESESIPIYHPDLEEFPCYVELTVNTFPYWSYFIKALKLNYETGSSPKNIESSLWGYLFYFRTPTYAIGYAKRLSKSKVLRKRLLKGGLVDRNIVFNSVENVKGIEIDNSADFVFVVKFNPHDNPIESWGIIWNKSNFESLLDVYEHQRQKAMEILNQCHTLPRLLPEDSFNTFKEVIKGNRQLHKMLLNPITKLYMNEVTIDDFKEVKEKFGNEVSFDVDERSGKIILPFPDSSREYLKAVREVLGVIGARFTKTLNNRHISRGKPEELR